MSRYPLDILLALTNHAENCLQIHRGVNSYQLAFGRSPKLPNVMGEELPVSEGKTTSETMARHLNALHSAREDRRENAKKLLGPARVTFQDGKVIFVRQGGVTMKVSSTRLVKANIHSHS